MKQYQPLLLLRINHQQTTFKELIRSNICLVEAGEVTFVWQQYQPPQQCQQILQPHFHTKIANDKQKYKKTKKHNISHNNTIESTYYNCFGMTSRKMTSSSSMIENGILPVSDYVFPPPAIPAIKVTQQKEEATKIISSSLFPIHRIYCVAKNYTDHIKEMGGDPSREEPCFFMKPADAIVDCAYCTDSTASTAVICTKIPYPLCTNNLHYEIELVLALGKGGKQIPVDDAMQYIFGYSVGCDLTRRDLQTIAKNNGRPWDSSKGFDQSAPVGHIYPATDILNKAFTDPMTTTTTTTATTTTTTTTTTTAAAVSTDGTNGAKIWLKVNNVERQSSTIQNMVWNIPEIISKLSHEFELQPGDLIFTGTPAGVGPISKLDVVTGGIDGIGQISFTIV